MTDPPIDQQALKAITWFSTSGDTGISSETIWSVMTGFPVKKWSSTIPVDPSDFGRCYRLLIQFPEWAERIQEVADRHEEWQPLVDQWDELVHLYERDMHTGKSMELYDLLTKFRGY